MNNLEFTNLSQIDAIVKKAVRDAIANHAARGESISFVENGEIVTKPAADVIESLDAISNDSDEIASDRLISK